MCMLPVIPQPSIATEAAGRRRILKSRRLRANRLAWKGTPCCCRIHIQAIRMFGRRLGNLQIVANKPSAKGNVLSNGQLGSNPRKTPYRISVPSGFSIRTTTRISPILGYSELGRARCPRFIELKLTAAYSRATGRVEFSPGCVLSRESKENAKKGNGEPIAIPARSTHVFTSTNASAGARMGCLPGVGPGTSR